MNTKKKLKREIFECPNCGADVPVGAKVCKECGSDDTTGWQSAEQKDYAQVDLPDGYREGEGSELPPAKTATWVRWTAVIAAAAMVLAAIGYALVKAIA